MRTIIITLATLLSINSLAYGQETREASPAVVNSVFVSPLQNVISMDGTWQFALDPEDKGQQQQWYKSGKDMPKETTIEVPACWESKGHKDYTGSAWYKKTIIIPNDWQQKTVWLKIGAVNAQGWFWVNGTYMGHLNEYVGTYKYNITDLVATGKKVTVTALVRNDVGSRKGLQNSFKTFGGLYRSVELEATPDHYIDNAYVVGDLDEKKAVVHVDVKRSELSKDPDADYSLEISVNKLGKGSKAVAGKSKTTFSFNADFVKKLSVAVDLNPCIAWSPDNPQLYRANITLKKDGKPIHGWTERFGVRKWEVRGHQFYLNNKPFYMRAFGDDWTYPIHLSSPASLEFHRKNLKLARDFGFNYVRHHTHTEIPEFYEAADEIGILVQPEFYMHGYDTAQYNESMAQEAKDEFLNTFIHMGRYVSFSTYCNGNESWILPPYDQQIYEYVKKLDPSRLMHHQDGGNNLPNNSDFATSWGDKKFNRPWAFSYMEYNNADKNTGLGDDMPHALHEFLNIAAEQDPRLEPKWTGGQNSPVSLENYRKTLARFGLSDKWGGEIIDAGYKMQSDLQKYGIESARVVPWLDGYCFWTIVDYYTMSSQGLFDPFWEIKNSTPELFAQFNGPTSIVARGIPNRPIFGAAETNYASKKRTGFFIIAGQSNASGHQAKLDSPEEPHERIFVFGNDYKWKIAKEPIDNPTGQIDKVSDDSGYVNQDVGHSFALKAAKDLVSSGVSEIKLIPCAKGGSSIAQWRRGNDPVDRNTLFGSCNHRSKVAAEDGVTAIWWHQGESDGGNSMNKYINDQTQLVRELRTEMGMDLPIIYAQLARYGSGLFSAQHHIAEGQRRLETNSGYDSALKRFHMVVTFDLPMSADVLHLTSQAQKEIGRRIALATRQHVYGEKVDGTGPRLITIYHPQDRFDQIKVVFNQPINKAINNYDNQFQVFDRSQKIGYNWGNWEQEYDRGYKIGDLGRQIEVINVVRDPHDETAVLITLAEKTENRVRVVYGGVPAQANHWYRNVIKGSNDLPSPAFGPLIVGEDLNATPNGKIITQWFVSNYGGSELKNRKLKWRFKNGSKTISSGKTSRFTVEHGQCMPVATSMIDIPTVKKATKAMLTVEISGTDIKNSWPVWIFPQPEAKLKEGITITDSLYEKLSDVYYPVKSSDNKTGGVLVTDDVGVAFESLKENRNVLLLARNGIDLIDATASMSWWGKNNQTGTAVAEHPAFGDFPHGGYLSPAMYRLTKRSMPLTEGHRPVDKLMVGSGRSGYHTYAFETKVGDSNLFITTLDLLSGLPEANYLLDSFINYTASENFNPKGSVELNAIGGAWGRRASLNKICNGVQEILKTAETGMYNTFAGSLKSNLCRGTDGTSQVVWKTQPVDKDLDPAQVYTFTWAAGTGYTSEPPAEFTLYLNDKKLLAFGITMASETWQSADGSCKLDYQVEQVSGLDSSGFMKLTVPASLLKPGEAAVLKVIGSNSNSNRWFSVYAP